MEVWGYMGNYKRSYFTLFVFVVSVEWDKWGRVKKTTEVFYKRNLQELE